MRHVPVAIIGGGPVGMVLAMNLATFDVPVLLVNIEQSSRWHPKGSTHNARTMEHYRRLGISGELRKLGLSSNHPTDVGYFTTLNGWELARIPMPSESEKMARVKNAAATDQIPEPLFRCNQMYVERRLFEHIQTSPTVEARYGWRCLEIEEGGPRIRITIEEIETGNTEQIECDYLAGCDGGNSMVRKHLGYVFEGEPPVDQPYAGGATVSTHLRAPDLYRDVLRNPCWQYWTVNPNVRSNLVTLDGEGEFLFNTRFQSADDLPDHAFITNRFQESVGEKVSIEIIDHWPWTAGFAHVADHFGRGPILLAGDSVHLFTPTGGFGMNTGVDDTANLGWKIAAMVQGWGGPDLLASYELERRPVAIRNTGMSKQFSLNVGKVPVVPDLTPRQKGTALGPNWEHILRPLRKSLRPSGYNSAHDTTIRRLLSPMGRHRPTTHPHTYPPHVRGGGRPTFSFRTAAPCSTIWESALRSWFSMANTILRR
jgi:2-polyprenyl-6-methoxyphenol hydroxylase-like FAD-dependent oxidoreductase